MVEEKMLGDRIIERIDKLEHSIQELNSKFGDLLKFIQLAMAVLSKDGEIDKGFYVKIETPTMRECCKKVNKKHKKE